jgi:hypothetical protein
MCDLLFESYYIWQLGDVESLLGLQIYHPNCPEIYDARAHGLVFQARLETCSCRQWPDSHIWRQSEYLVLLCKFMSPHRDCCVVGPGASVESRFHGGRGASPLCYYQSEYSASVASIQALNEYLYDGALFRRSWRCECEDDLSFLGRIVCHFVYRGPRAILG